MVYTEPIEDLTWAVPFKHPKNKFTGIQNSVLSNVPLN